MIDLQNEQIISLAEAARSLPGGSVHVSTIHRWRLRGVRGVKLSTVMRGGARRTSREAIERFCVAVTAASEGETPPTRTARQRRRAIRAAEAELNKAGI